MKTDYTDYSSEDLLNDPYFVSSIENPTEESRAFWNRQIENGTIAKQQYKQAVLFITVVKRVRKKTLPAEEEVLLLERIKNTNRNYTGKKKRYELFLKMTAAACIGLLIVSLAVWLVSDGRTDIKTVAEMMKPAGDTEETLLILFDEKEVNVDEKSSSIEHDAGGSVKVNSRVVDISDVQNQKKERSYNQLIVPKGRRSTLILQDGTKLYVNAGSRVIYPINFEKHKREIFVDGELFLEVAPDKDNPFVVRTGNMDVEVLGTSFNVMSYEEDEDHSVVLVTGSVMVRTDNKERNILQPNTMFLYADGNSRIKEVDPFDYTSWKEGLYKYKGEKLSVIFNRLIRYYGEDIQYDQEVGELTCSGLLDMQDDLDEVLDGIARTAPLKLLKTTGGYVFSVEKEK